jgi:hypothetical protein
MFTPCTAAAAVIRSLLLFSAAAQAQLPALPRVIPPSLPLQVVQVFWQVKLCALPEPLVGLLCFFVDLGPFTSYRQQDNMCVLQPVTALLCAEDYLPQALVYAHCSHRWHRVALFPGD